MSEYIISEPFTVEVTKKSYALDCAMDIYVLTKVYEYCEKLKLERITRCRDCKHNGTVRFVDVGFHETRVIDCEAVEPNGFCKWGERKSE